MPELAYLNGDFVPLERAMVHVEDRGYQFADAVYEVLRTYHGRVFALPEHLDRLWRSLQAIELAPAFSPQQLGKLIEQGVQQAGFAETMVYVQISRGQARRHRGIPAHCEPVLVLTFRALPDSSAARTRGISCISVTDQRWSRCDIKCVALLANVLAYNQAKRAGADDAIFVETDDTVNEATAGNVFLVRDGQLITPARSPKLLGGITRDKLLQLAQDLGLPAVERRVLKPELLAADELFLSSTTAEVVPVRQLDGQSIGTGQPGPIGTRLYHAFVGRFASA